MSNTYTQLSFTVSVPKEAANYAIDLNAQLQESGDFPTGCDLYYDNERGTLWVVGDESANADAIGDVLQKMLAKFNISGAVVIHWALTCSKMMSDEFCGGTVIVTKDTVITHRPFDWAEDKLAELGTTAL